MKPPTKARRRILRKCVFAIGLVLCLIAISILFVLFNEDMRTDLATRLMSQRLGSAVSLEHLNLYPAIEVGELRLGDAGRPPTVSSSDFSVDYAWSWNTFCINTVRADQVSLHIVDDRQGATNYDWLRRLMAQPGDTPANLIPDLVTLSDVDLNVLFGEWDVALDGLEVALAMPEGEAMRVSLQAPMARLTIADGERRLESSSALLRLEAATEEGRYIFRNVQANIPTVFALSGAGYYAVSDKKQQLNLEHIDFSVSDCAAILQFFTEDTETSEPGTSQSLNLVKALEGAGAVDLMLDNENIESTGNLALSAMLDPNAIESLEQPEEMSVEAQWRLIGKGFGTDAPYTASGEITLGHQRNHVDFQGELRLPKGEVTVSDIDLRGLAEIQADGHDAIWKLLGYSEAFESLTLNTGLALTEGKLHLENAQGSLEHVALSGEYTLDASLSDGALDISKDDADATRVILDTRVSDVSISDGESSWTPPGNPVLSFSTEVHLPSDTGETSRPIDIVHGVVAFDNLNEVRFNNVQLVSEPMQVKGGVNVRFNEAYLLDLGFPEGWIKDLAGTCDLEYKTDGTILRDVTLESQALNLDAFATEAMSTGISRKVPAAVASTNAITSNAAGALWQGEPIRIESDDPASLILSDWQVNTAQSPYFSSKFDLDSSASLLGRLGYLQDATGTVSVQGEMYVAEKYTEILIRALEMSDLSWLYTSETAESSAMNIREVSGSAVLDVNIPATVDAGVAEPEDVENSGLESYIYSLDVSGVVANVPESSLQWLVTPLKRKAGEGEATFHLVLRENVISSFELQLSTELRKPEPDGSGDEDASQSESTASQPSLEELLVVRMWYDIPTMRIEATVGSIQISPSELTIPETDLAGLGEALTNFDYKKIQPVLSEIWQIYSRQITAQLEGMGYE